MPSETGLTGTQTMTKLSRNLSPMILPTLNHQLLMTQKWNRPKKKMSGASQTTQKSLIRTKRRIATGTTGARPKKR